MRRSSSKAISALCFLLIAASLAQAQDQPSPATPPAISGKDLKGVDTSNRRELTEEEIQQRFFKKPQSQEPVTVYMPIFYERMQRALGRVRSRVEQASATADMKIELDGNGILTVLKELTVPSWMERMKGLRLSVRAKPETTFAGLLLRPLAIPMSS